MAGVKTLLLSILKDLTDGQFEEFKLYLQEKGIKLCELETSTRIVTVNLMVGYFTNNAAQTSIEILSKINRKELASRLSQGMAEIEGKPGGSSAADRAIDSQRTTASSGEHFLDRHMEDLVQKVYLVGPILDRLLAKKVVTQEMYDEVMALNTSQSQMRKIYSGPLRSAGNAGKDILYDALRELQPFLVNDLESKV